MEATNQTCVSHFFLLGLTEDPVLQPLIFCLFLSIYLVTILGNVLIIFLVSSDSHLQTPMYLFLSNLSFSEICLSTTVIPKMLVNIQTQDRSITHIGCLIQACFVLDFSALESCLLAVMAYDRYAAICHPLSYTVIMNPHFCGMLLLCSFLISMMNTVLIGFMSLQLSFCTDVEVPLFCELSHVVKLSCSNTFINNILVYIITFLFGIIPTSGIIFSYTQIVSSILRISSARGRYKAFSTCGSHLSVVSLFYGAGLWVYITSSINVSPKKNTAAYVMCTVIPQMLNPFIYSLRNRDMREALQKLIRKAASLL